MLCVHRPAKRQWADNGKSWATPIFARTCRERSRRDAEDIVGFLLRYPMLCLHRKSSEKFFFFLIIKTCSILQHVSLSRTWLWNFYNFWRSIFRHVNLKFYFSSSKICMQVAISDAQWKTRIVWEEAKEKGVAKWISRTYENRALPRRIH